MKKLAPLVRCPHPSHFWLSASYLSDDAYKLLLIETRPRLKELLLLKAACRSDASLIVANLRDSVLNVPASWLLPVRDIQPVSSASMQWELDVAAIREAAQDSASRRGQTVLKSTHSCLLGGISWGIELHAYPSEQGTMLGLYTRAKSLPSASICHCTYSMECVGVAMAVTKGSQLFQKKGEKSAWGWHNFFRVGVMSGGFDEAAWAAKGLPTSGNIVLKLTVADVDM